MLVDACSAGLRLYVAMLDALLAITYVDPVMIRGVVRAAVVYVTRAIPMFAVPIFRGIVGYYLGKLMSVSLWILLLGLVVLFHISVRSIGLSLVKLDLAFERSLLTEFFIESAGVMPVVRLRVNSTIA